MQICWARHNPESARSLLLIFSCASTSPRDQLHSLFQNRTTSNFVLIHSLALFMPRHPLGPLFAMNGVNNIPFSRSWIFWSRLAIGTASKAEKESSVTTSEIQALAWSLLDLISPGQDHLKGSWSHETIYMFVANPAWIREPVRVILCQ